MCIFRRHKAYNTLSQPTVVLALTRITILGNWCFQIGKKGTCLCSNAETLNLIAPNSSDENVCGYIYCWYHKVFNCKGCCISAKMFTGEMNCVFQQSHNYGTVWTNGHKCRLMYYMHVVISPTATCRPQVSKIRKQNHGATIWASDLGTYCSDPVFVATWKYKWGKQHNEIKQPILCKSHPQCLLKHNSHHWEMWVSAMQSVCQNQTFN